ncbi:ABC transporter [Paenibacillus pini JCM 16418]|uniref:ABC transporter n=1 Tax=Paenibacillus pini JCM 16418 TaxID=1236976 RepID=W7YC62_9BACL|nr:ABC transporter [Paenibacillus pini JCM 16418]
MTSAVKETGRDKIFLICNYIYVFLAFIIVAYPLVYMISASISDPKLVGSGEMWLFPKGITFDGYKRVFENNSIWVGYRNTILYTVVGTAINLIVTLPAAYALSRKDFLGRNFFMGMFMVTMFFGGGLVPTYLLIKNLGMINTMWAIVIPSAASIWNIIVSRTFFQSSIPKELQEQPKSTDALTYGYSLGLCCHYRCRLSQLWLYSMGWGIGITTSQHLFI